MLGLETEKRAFLKAIDGHIMAAGELMGEQVSQKQIRRFVDGL